MDFPDHTVNLFKWRFPKSYGCSFTVAYMYVSCDGSAEKKNLFCLVETIRSGYEIP